MLRNLGLAGALLAIMIVPLLLLPLIWSDGSAYERLPLAQPGETSAILLADGHPAWLVGHSDGSVSVLDAFSSHAPFGISKLTRWCQNALLFEDPFHGRRYNEYGDKTYGPAPSGLRAYPITERENYLRLDGLSRARPLNDELEQPEWLACDEAGRVVHDFATLSQVISPARAVESDAVTWQRFHGSLWPRPEAGTGLLCAWLKPDDGCVEVSLPHMRHYEAGLGEPFSGNLWVNTDWLLRAEHGRIAELVLTIPAAD